MKFIHCADLHLDSPLTSKFTPKQAERIKAESFSAFEKLIANAIREDVKVVVIAGDLFDGSSISPAVINRFKQIISFNSQITFIFVYGNHDYNPTYNPFKDFSTNFKVLQENQSIIIDDAMFTAYSHSLSTLASNYYNVVIGHGDESTNPTIDFVSARGKNIDYLALGHIHSSKLERLDERGVWAYSGCLSPRGWDECGEKGYYLVDTSTRTYTFKVIKGFTFNEYVKDITPFKTLLEFENQVQQDLAGFNEDIALRLVITGKIQDEHFLDFSYLTSLLSQKFYHFEIKDKTIVNIDSLVANSVSLKSEFIKVVEKNDYTQEDKKQIIEIGLKYLK